MEDEEILPENSDLSNYLQSLGYSDVQTFKAFVKENALNYSTPKGVPEECVDMDIIEDIQAILSTQMLFEEDVSSIESLLSNFKLTKDGMLRKMFQGTTAFLVLLLGLSFYWFLGAYAFIFVSVFYAYRASDYLYQKHYSHKRLKNLMSVLEDNYTLLKKALKFIQENNEIVCSNFSSHVSESNTGHFILLRGLESEFIKSEQVLIRILCKATQKLIKSLPMHEYIESPEYYLCNSITKLIAETRDITKLHQFYLLIQSEFLQRLALTLIPNLQLSQEKHCKLFNKIIKETTFNLLKSENGLNKKFKYVFLNGIHPRKQRMKPKPAKPLYKISKYSEELVANIHETSSILQALLIKARMIEDDFHDEKLTNELESELINIQKDLDDCHKNISDCFILIKKYSSDNSCPKVQEVEENEELETADQESNCILVGFTDLDPKVDDEIFEVEFDNLSEREKYVDDDYDFEDRLKRKLEKEYSKKVLNELKAKLVDKAKDWEAREVNILKKKGLTVENDTSLNNKSEVPRSDDEKVLSQMTVKDFQNSLDDLSFLKTNADVIWPLTHLKRSQIPRKNGRIVTMSCSNETLSDKKNLSDNEKSSQEYQAILLNNNHNINNEEEEEQQEEQEEQEQEEKEEKEENEENEESEECEEDRKIPNFRIPDVNFLANLTEARRRILKIETEEIFCNSEENSSDEI